MDGIVVSRNDAGAAYVLWFQSLFDAGRAMAFPCDARGDVDIDALSSRARDNYLCARTLVGHDYSVPEVRPCGPH